MLWRIQALGAVEQTLPEAKIEVHLCEGALAKAEPGKPKSEPRWTKAKIGVGQFAYLTLGSYWQHRRRLDRSAGVRRILTNIQIEEGRFRLVPLLHSVGDTDQGKPKWMIPPFHYPLPRDVYKSQCLAIENDGDPYGILLPVSEAIRFYYARSTDLANVMFNGLLQHSPEDVYDAALSGKLENSERMVVSRTSWIADNDCWILGRILGDEFARKGAERIHDSLTKAAANRAATFPECDLPFRGITNWAVRAVDISAAREKPRWLVLEIERCSAPFPFQELEVIADNDGRKANRETDRPDDEKIPAWQQVKKHAIANKDDQLQSDDPPVAAVEPVVLTNPGECFDVLYGKQVIKTPKSECRYKSAQLHSTTVDGENIGTGDGTHGETKVKPGELVWDKREEEQQKRNRRKSLEASFAALYAVVDAINATDGARATVRESKLNAYIPLTEPQNRRQWSYLDSASRQRRETMLIDISAGDRHACLVEFQQRVGERCVIGLLICHGRPLLEDIEVSKLLLLLAKKKGVWRNVRYPSEGIEIKSIRHTKPTAEELANALIDMLLAPVKD
jgi:hypothetical protein